MKGDFISCYLLLQPTLRNVSCKKNKTPSKQWYYRSTIKMHASSPVATALFFIPSLCAKHNMDFAQATLSGLP